MRRGSPARRKRRSYSGVESSLLVGRREDEGGGAHSALVAEDEAHLARRPQPLGSVRAEGRASLVLAQGAQQIAPEVAILAGDRLALRHPVHALQLVDRAA